jgi:hypothetical protein
MSASLRASLVLVGTGLLAAGVYEVLFSDKVLQLDEPPPPPVYGAPEPSQPPPPYVRLTPTQREDLLAGDYQLLRHVADLPARCQAGLRAAAREDSLDMAGPGEEYQVSDVVTRPGLHWRRLILGGVNGQRCFIHYENGGIAHSFHVVMIDMGSPLKLLWHGALDSAHPDITSLRKSLRKASDGPYYF